MKKIAAVLLAILILSLLFTACDTQESSTQDASSSENAGSADGTQSGNAGLSGEDKNQMFSDRDSRVEYDASKAVAITLNGSSIACSSKAVTVADNKATITDEGTYVISGKLNDGMIAVNAGETDKVQIVLSGVDITSGTSAAIYVINADKVFVTLADNSKNTLANGGSFVAVDSNNIDAAVYSTQDITFNGNGTLTVKSPAGHGILTKDDLVFTSGTYNVTSALRGLDANDSVRIKDATISVNSGKDAVRSQNVDDATKGFLYMQSGTLKLTSTGDAISTSAYLQIDNGKVNIKTTSSDTTVSTKALKSDTDVILNGGEITIDAADDGINANKKVFIAGGKLNIKTADDGINASELLSISGGTVQISESYEGIDVANFEITDGVLDVVSGNDALSVSIKDVNAQVQSGEMVVEGGEITLKANSDCIDVKGNIIMSGGSIIAYGNTVGSSTIISCTEKVSLTGGDLVAFGANKPTLTYDAKCKPIISLTVDVVEADKPFAILDSNENKLIEFNAKYSFTEVFVISSKLTKDGAYKVSVNNVLTDVTAQ